MSQNPVPGGGSNQSKIRFSLTLRPAGGAGNCSSHQPPSPCNSNGPGGRPELQLPGYCASEPPSPRSFKPAPWKSCNRTPLVVGLFSRSNANRETLKPPFRTGGR